MNQIPRRTFVKWTTLGTIATASQLRAQDAAAAAVHSLAPLPFAADALAPHIDTETMNIHHGKHHAAYVTKLNEGLELAPTMKKHSIDALMPQLAAVSDAAVQTTLRNNGGGHWNHTFFWNTMAPAKNCGTPSETLTKAINDSFGSLDQFKSQFAEAALKRFGSGWAWLIAQNGKLKITSTPNQDNPLMTGLVADSDCGIPLLGIDVWEHAYYLNYQNRRVDYITAWWNVVNWNAVSKRLP